MEDDKHHYIAAISAASDHYGNYLIALMDEYGKSNLQEITADQAKAFYFKYINKE